METEQRSETVAVVVRVLGIVVAAALLARLVVRRRAAAARTEPRGGDGHERVPVGLGLE